MAKLKFSLRDLFWLVLVVGMGCAWWVESGRGTTWRKRAEALARFQEDVGRVEVEWTENSVLLWRDGAIRAELYNDAREPLPFADGHGSLEE